MSNITYVQEYNAIVDVLNQYNAGGQYADETGIQRACHYLWRG
ncbi:hypothetical protein [Serratia odorifera]|uniref:Uncharacterized protein n=1 Tax=Serratia odorifera TaxID=618 RepID=A0A447KV71_SEROD|nr:hypothetical protein [Serratia odorifera]VDZ61146.1 Uncharacterised protein [Serratia odorifera]